MTTAVWERKGRATKLNESKSSYIFSFAVMIPPLVFIDGHQLFLALSFLPPWSQPDPKTSGLFFCYLLSIYVFILKSRPFFWSVLSDPTTDGSTQRERIEAEQVENLFSPCFTGQPAKGRPPAYNEAAMVVVMCSILSVGSSGPFWRAHTFHWCMILIIISLQKTPRPRFGWLVRRREKMEIYYGFIPKKERSHAFPFAYDVGDDDDGWKSFFVLRRYHV